MAARACKKKNPAELVIFANPRKRRAKRRNAGTANHKPKCECFACKHKRGEKVPKSKTTLKKASNRAGRASFKKTARPHRVTNHKSRITTHRRRNPSDSEQAVKLFESFHGKDASEVIEAQRSAAMRLDYTALGPLVALGFEDGGYSADRLAKKWDTCNHINFDGDKVMLASAPNGKQLYFIGGNQNLDGSMADFEVDLSKDLIDLGEVYFVCYEAAKIHDNFERADYCHRFGKGDQDLPRLAYDKLKKEMLLIGGEYFISTKAGISPGIEG